MAEFSHEFELALSRALSDTRSQARRVAVFDFDNTLIFNDIGELFSYYMIDEMAYRYDLDAFWELIDPDDGQAVIRAAVEEAFSMPPEVRRASTAYDVYRREMSAIYGRKLARDGKRSCYEWAVRLHVGLTQTQMLELSEASIKQELASPVREQIVQTARGESIRFTRGVRMLEPMRRLIERFEADGVEVWICSASNYWTISAFASRYGVPNDRIIANRVHLEGEILTANLVEPVKFEEGKAEAILREIGMPATFAFGDSEADLHMLSQATGLATIIDTGQAPELIEEARSRGWAIQPQAPLVSAK